MNADQLHTPSLLFCPQETLHVDCLGSETCRLQVVSGNSFECMVHTDTYFLGVGGDLILNIKLFA